MCPEASSSVVAIVNSGGKQDCCELVCWEIREQMMSRADRTKILGSVNAAWHLPPAKASTKWDGEVGPHGVGVGAPSSAMHGPLNPWGPEPSSRGKSRIKIQDRPALSLPQIAGKLPYPALHQLQAESYKKRERS